MSREFSPQEKKGVWGVLVLFLASSLFWSIFEQAGSTLTLFADRRTDNRLFGWEYPPSWFQSANSFYIVMGMAAFFAWLWVRLGKHDPSVVAKFAFGLFGAGGGFLVMMAASQASNDGKTLVGPGWLAACYFLHTTGEMCLSPVGMSAMSKLAPARIAGLMMGVWFLSISVGNFLAGYLGTLYKSLTITEHFGYLGAFGIAMGLVMLAISKPVTKLMGNVR